MLMLVYYHSLLLFIDLILLYLIWRDSYTSLGRFILIAEHGALAALFFGIAFSAVFEGYFNINTNLAAHGLALHGSFFLFVSALLMYRQKRSNGKPRLGLPSLVLLFGSLFCGVTVDALFVEPTGLVIRETRITTQKITKPITIVFCSDLHIAQVWNYERWILQKINEQNADLIVFGGDYVRDRTVEDARRLMKEWNQLFREVNLQAPLGIYAIQGTLAHDWVPWKEMFADTEVILHENTFTEQIGEIRVTFLSVQDSWATSPIPDEDQKNPFRIIVGHAPRYAMAAQEADVLLAGHTHGGQVRIPFLGPLVTASGDFPKKWASGITDMPNGAKLIVSNGAGLSQGKAPRIRFLCRPDILVVRLVPVK
jgi:predicted MPP superfamily phosphohydrolase